MSSLEAVTSYVSHKVSKVRWLKQELSSYDMDRGLLASGSWDDSQNRVCFWRFKFSDSEVEPMEEEEEQEELERLRLLGAIKHHGDVNDLQFLRLHKSHESHIFTVSSTGNASIIEVNAKQTQHRRPGDGGSPLKTKFLQHLHHGKATSLDVRGDHQEFVTGGEDGKLNFVSLEELRLSSSIPSRGDAAGDTGTITCVQYHSQPNTVLTSSTSAHIKELDIRTGKPVTVVKEYVDVLHHEHYRRTSLTLYIPLSTSLDDASRRERTAVRLVGYPHSLSHHPSQLHYIIAGYTDGSVVLWDWRNPRVPVSSAQRHASYVWEVRFHTGPGSPRTAYSCGEDGLLVRWEYGGAHALFPLATVKPATAGVVFTPENRIEVSPLLSTELGLNSFDVQTDVEPFCLVSGGDSEFLSFVVGPV